MIPIERIVGATDMAPFASRAEARAAMLAHDLGSESLHLLHIIDNVALEALRHLGTAPLETEQRLMESSREQLAEIERRLSEKYGIQVMTTTLNVGRAHTEIVHYAELIDASLVVLGAHGGGIVRHLFVGSTVDKVLRKLTRPLLIVKREPEAPYQKILIPVDFSEASWRATKFAMSFAPHAHKTALHAFEVPLQAKLHSAGIDYKLIKFYEAEIHAQKKMEMRQFVSNLEASGISVTYIVKQGATFDIIRKQMATLEPDLVVIGRHGQTEREDMLLGSVITRVIQDADCDVLVVG
ncbi:universal stress protein [Nitrosospira sp. Nsp13]|uniref:universal stress protein n=1 Tax=Nitrosospira sp. Nsp13 TaxID=1855332 RepID=UPI00088D8959|nr:universal stress protein [Nitrosospira sp. Nsp13]SCY38603.1 Nucleotide-binding universal stress protein, UspA family [Nitrosospira sp. Nsp13]